MAITQSPSFEELVTRRYGANAPEIVRDFDLSNPVLELQFGHKSVRHYQDTPLPAGTVEALAAAGQSASSSSNLQAWSLVAIQDPEHKNAAAALCGNQEFIRQAPLFLLFVADLARVKWISTQEGYSAEALDYLEMFLIGALDAALASQNVALAAESLGLGVCYVGAARNNSRQLADLVKLPARSIVVFGLTVGYAVEELTTTVKPRLPQPGLLHYETYAAEHWEDEVAAYNEVMEPFYASQSLADHPSWSQTVAKRVADKKSLGNRWELHQILQERGLALK